MKTLGKNNLKKSIEKIVEAQKNYNDWDSSYLPFVKRFIKSVIKEAEEPSSPENFTPEKNKEDYSKALEPTTQGGQFDVEGIDPKALANAISKVHEWSSKLDEIVHFLNDTDSQSLHRLLADFDRPGSLVKGITRKTSDGITRVAGEIAKLKQTLDGFINLAPKKQRDTEALVTGGAS